MKKILIILFLFPILLSAQVRDTIPAGRHAITTLGSNDYVREIDVPTIILSKSGVLQADELFYVRNGASLDTISSFSFTANKRPAILFERGGKWTGTITVNRNDIVYGSYGTGAKPIMTGLATITGWTNEGGGIYSQVLSVESNPEIVTVNGVQFAMGRTPNSYRYAPKYADYYHIDSFTGTTSITDSECNSATTNWTGAELVVRTSNHMNWARCPITVHSGTTLTITNSFTVAAGYGYFIQNDLRTLDQLGEWYYGGGKFYMYFGAATPGDFTVKVSTKNTLIDVNTRDFITVKNIHFEGANQNAVETNSSSYAYNLTVDNCIFNNNNRGVYGNAAPELTIKNSTFTNQAFMAIYNHWDSDGAYIANNTIDSTGLVIGVGAGEGSWYKGIALYSSYGHHTYSSKNTIIEYNKILNSGYIGLTFGSDSAKVRYNLISKYNQIKSDGGAIYYGIPEAYPHINQLIDHNICLNGRTQTDSLGMPQNQITYACYNIYLDNNSNGGFTVTNNTSAHTKGAGLMVHMSEDVVIKNNTIYDCETGVKFQEQSGYSPSSIREIDMQNNIIVAKKSAQKNVSVRSLNNDFNLFGTINNNWYARPFDINPMFISMVNTWVETVRDSATWRSTTTWDTNSVFSKIQIQNDDSVRFYTNPTNSAVVYALNDTLVDATGAKYNTSVTVPAYSSKVLWNDDMPAYTVKKLGTQTIGGTAFSATTRMGMPYTFTEAGQITAIVIYNSGQLATGGNILLGVYDNTGSTGLPGTKLAETNIQETQSFAGWQRINLKTPLSVTNGQTVWLCWVEEKSLQLWYTAGSPGRAQTTGTTWAQGLPSTFGTSTQASSLYSIYCIYK